MHHDITTLFHRSLLDQPDISEGLLVVESTELTTTKDAKRCLGTYGKKEISKNIRRKMKWKQTNTYQTKTRRHMEP